MKILETMLPGCFEVIAPVHRDNRGRFTKVMHEPEYSRAGLTCAFKEEYYTWSGPRVLRGMHLQVPPAEHIKLVYCAAGQVMDVLLDLRPDSPTFGQHAQFELSEERGNSMYVAAGVAHGFYVLGAGALMVYKVTTVHSAPHDAGVRWDSAGIAWPAADPIISDRDARLPSLADFRMPRI